MQPVFVFFSYAFDFCVVTTCSNSSTVVNLVLKRELKFHLIFIERLMPVMDGYQFLQFLNEKKIDIPLIYK